MACSHSPLLWGFVLFAILVSNPTCLCDAKAKDYTNWRIFKVGPTTGQHQIRSLNDFLNIYKGSNDVRILTDVVTATDQFDMAVTPGKLSRVTRELDATSISFEQIVANIKMEILIEKLKNKVAQAHADLQKSMSGEYVVELPHYYMDYDQINDYLKRIVKEARGRAELFYIGDSYEGRPMYGVKVNNGTGKPKLWIDAGIHAREWLSIGTALHILHQVVFNESWAIRCVADSFTWLVLPVFNPDGYQFTWTDERMWRKNRRPYLNCTEQPCKEETFGVDLNRNFDFNWAEGEKDPTLETYHGTSPFSEPEARNVRDILLKESDNMHIYISLHCYSQLWMFPWAGMDSRTPDFDELERVANASARAIFAVHGEVYRVGNLQEIMYLAHGTSMDWAKNTTGIKYAYTIELHPNGLNAYSNDPFILPPSQIKPTGEEILAGVLSAAHLVKQRIEEGGEDGP